MKGKKETWDEASLQQESVTGWTSTDGVKNRRVEPKFTSVKVLSEENLEEKEKKRRTSGKDKVSPQSEVT